MLIKENEDFPKKVDVVKLWIIEKIWIAWVIDTACIGGCNR